MKLAIGVPLSHGFPVPVPFLHSRDSLLHHLRGSVGTAQAPSEITGFAQIRSEGFPVDVARNQIVRLFLESDCDALLFLDADHTFAPDLADRLVSHHKPVITARYHIRHPPYHANCYVNHPLAPKGEYKTVHYGRGVFEIDRGGAGALLIQRDVLDAIGGGTVYRDDGGPEQRGDWFKYQRNQTHDKPSDFDVSEDFWFYQRAQEEGFSCWVDWDTEAKHLAQIEVGLEHQQAYISAMESELTPELAAQLVACGFDEPIHVGGGDGVGPFRIAPFHVAGELERTG